MGSAQENDNFEAWVGRSETKTEQIHPAVMAQMAATLDRKTVPQEGDPLPPGWQWLFFNPAAARSELGTDGHPAKGGFLPPVPLPRRMWAGSRIQYLAALPVGATASRTSKILKVTNKTGKSGALCFVTVEHRTSVADTLCIVEEQDLVYREASAPGAAPKPTPNRHDDESQWCVEFVPDTTLLFRYSALTFNGHRIHYDRPYAINEEGYPGLVVHGPLTATLLQQFAVEHGHGRALAGFDFRGVNPLFVDRAFHLEARGGEEGSLVVWARGPDGELGMSATAYFKE